MRGRVRPRGTSPRTACSRRLRRAAILATLLQAAFHPALAGDLDLAGVDGTLPVPGSFGDQSFLNGSDNLTNSGGFDATLTEGGGGIGTTYSGVVTDGATNTTAILHTNGEVTFTASNSYSGGTGLLGGKLIAGDDFALGFGGVSVLGNATLGLKNAVILSNTIDLGANLTVDVATGDAEIFGDIVEISPDRGLTKTGNGRLTLTGSNDYTGATHIVAGELFAHAPDALANFSDFVIDSGGKLTVGDNLFFFPGIGSLSGAGKLAIGDNTILTIGLTNKDTTFSGIISGLGSLEKTGTGTQTLTGRGSSLGGVLSLCDCGGIGGLDISGGSLKVGIGVLISNSALSITHGGLLEQTNAFGGLALDSGSVVVDGTGSKFVITGLTGVGGFFGDASMIIRNGGEVTSRNGADIAAAGGDEALVLVTGAGSLWTVANDLFIGCGCDPASLTIADGGTVRSTGDTVIANLATLNLGSGGRAGTLVTHEIENDGRIVADFTDTSTLAAIISGVGTLTKNGTGKLILTGNSSYTGNTTVNGGILAVNGANGNSSITVNADGTLGGTGTAGKTLLAGGTIGPGNSIGTLTVAGGLTFGAGSTYAVEAGGGNDLIRVVAATGGTGNAVLGGGAVDVTFGTGVVATRALILSAAGGLGGTTFTGVGDNLAAVVTSLVYDAGNVYVVSRLNLLGLPGLTVNQVNVATTLDGYFAGKGSFDLAFALDPAGLTLASGELGTASIQAGFEASDRFLDVISDRFVLPDGTTAGGGEATAYATESASGSGAADAYAMLLEKRSAHALAPMVDGRWKSFGAFYGAAAEVDGNETTVGSHDLDTDVFGLAAGASWREGDFGFGAALGGGRSSFDLADGLGSGDAGIFNAGVYARADWGRAYLSGALAYGYHDVDTDRAAFGETYSAGYGAHSFSGRAELGWRFAAGSVGLTPYAAVQGTAFHIPDYSETGSGAGTFALDYDSETATSARGELGLRLDHRIALDGAILELGGRAAWAHSGDNERSLVAGFQTLPGTSFTVYGAEPGRDSALVDLAARMDWTDGWSAALAFQGRFAEDYDSWSGTAKIGFAW